MSQAQTNQTQITLNPENWVDQYGNYLYHFALGRLRNTADAENVVQETFLAALKAKDRYAGKSTERTWLIGILKHKIIDHMRKSYREKPVTDLQKNEEAINEFFDHKDIPKRRSSGWLPDPEELLEKKEFWQVFQKCKEELPRSSSDAFTLREVERVDSKEICEILNITDSNLWVLLHRARLQLKVCLEINWYEKNQEVL